MAISKLSLHHGNAPLFLFKRFFWSKWFGCGCFGPKEEPKELPPSPDLKKDTNLISKGMCMPIVGLGTWQMKPEDVKVAITCAIEHGYRHIDTCFVYGNETEIGETLCYLLDSGKITRDRLFISSKLPYFGMCPEEVCDYVNKSLRNLQLNYLDLYMMHYPVGVNLTDKGPIPNDHTNHIAIWREMEKMVDGGKIKHLGLSNFNIRQAQNILESARILPANMQVEMHLYCQQKEMKEFCCQHGISLTAYAPLGSPSLDCFLKAFGLQSNGVPDPLENRSVMKISEWHKKCPSHILLRYLIQLGGVAIIPKSSCTERIAKNIDLFDFCLKPCEMKELCSLDYGDKGRMFSCNVWVGTQNNDEYPF